MTGLIYPNIDKNYADGHTIFETIVRFKRNKIWYDIMHKKSYLGLVEQPPNSFKERANMHIKHHYPSLTGLQPSINQ